MPRIKRGIRACGRETDKAKERRKSTGQGAHVGIRSSAGKSTTCEANNAVAPVKYAQGSAVLATAGVQRVWCPRLVASRFHWLIVVHIDIGARRSCVFRCTAWGKQRQRAHRHTHRGQTQPCDRCHEICRAVGERCGRMARIARRARLNIVKPKGFLTDFHGFVRGRRGVRGAVLAFAIFVAHCGRAVAPP